MKQQNLAKFEVILSIILVIYNFDVDIKCTLTNIQDVMSKATHTCDYIISQVTTQSPSQAENNSAAYLLLN